VNYVFAFDISNGAIQSGFLASACASLVKILYGGTDDDGLPLEPCFPGNSRLAILSFDRSLHFYNLSVHGLLLRQYVRFWLSLQPHFQHAPMMVLSDIDEIFLPLRDGLFVDPLESRFVCSAHFSANYLNFMFRTVIENLLEALPRRNEGSLLREAALGAALSASLAALVGHFQHLHFSLSWIEL
jgi:protein transport protein SEC24